MRELEELVVKIAGYAAARHRENSTTYFDALHQIIEISAGNDDPSMKLIHRIATKVTRR